MRGEDACTKCGESDWAPRSDSVNGRRCRSCRRAYHRAYAGNNRERLREYCRDWRRRQIDADTERVRSREKEWRRKGINITEQEYQRILEQQAGVCAICLGGPRGRWPYRLVVDHDHISGRIRGLLCDVCNKSIGALGDDAEVLQRAADYLRAA